ncbi:MAG: NAD(P)/FAD-dependent oxidoreductase [Bacteroidota bacterium]
MKQMPVCNVRSRYFWPLSMEKSSLKKTAIIGAGPAGLTGAYLLTKAGHDVTIFEKHPHYVGGISRTESYKGYHFDIGGHRFFSKSKEVEDFWTEILGDDMLDRPRSSRIYYNKQFFSYPLVATEALKRLGVIESARCVLSYLQVKVFPIKEPKNFEEWVTNKFGKRLFKIFFKTYTEKVWGIPCKDISADWAAQRIKGLSLSSAIKNAVFPPKKGDKGSTIKTLIDTFRYPKLGPGQMWETCNEKVQAMGGKVLMGKAVTGLHYNTNDKTWDLSISDGSVHAGFDHVISAAPLRELVRAITPAVSAPTLDAANQLAYRDFLTVVLIMKDKQLFADNWIYIHDPSVKMGRVQNFKSWSPFLVPDPTMACYGLEYFCFEGDGLWNSTDKELEELGIKELEQVGLAHAADIVDSYVVRQPKAYPVYDHFYEGHVFNIREGLKDYQGLYLVGRNGMHKYNNQDHSMMTAMLAARNIIAGEELYDLWQVNGDAEYHEEGERGVEGGRLVPEKVR